MDYNKKDIWIMKDVTIKYIKKPTIDAIDSILRPKKINRYYEANSFVIRQLLSGRTIEHIGGVIDSQGHEYDNMISSTVINAIKYRTILSMDMIITFLRMRKHGIMTPDLRVYRHHVVQEFITVPDTVILILKVLTKSKKKEKYILVRDFAANRHYVVFDTQADALREGLLNKKIYD